MLSLSDPRDLYHAAVKLRVRLLHDSDAVIRVGQLFLAFLNNVAGAAYMSGADATYDTADIVRCSCSK